MSKPSRNEPPPKPNAWRAEQDEVPVHLSFSVTYKELEKPQGGGGKGTEMPYKLFICIDGEEALQILAHDFKYVGQMRRLTTFLESVKSAGDPPKAPKRGGAKA